jgi:ribosomal protein S18 acetylase RimI-like enzyme
VGVVVEYRSFRNTDPPALADTWNATFMGRGAIHLRHSTPLENFVFSKPYFDPIGLILAVDGGSVIGFGHAGFGANPSGSALQHSDGVICAIGVRPEHRRKGIGSELLRRLEDYLVKAGAHTVFGGPMAPHDPFYLGLYGGSELPGFLASDRDAHPFLIENTYQLVRTRLVFQRPLNQPLNVVDSRFVALRRSFDVRITPQTGPRTWWQEATANPLEVVEFRLTEKTTGGVAARMSVWEMDGFSCRWNQPAVGIIDIEVRENLRRQGLAKYLLSQMLRYLQEQFFGIAEVQAADDNAPVISLYQGLGFQQVDVGHMYEKRIKDEG